MSHLNSPRPTSGILRGSCRVWDPPRSEGAIVCVAGRAPINALAQLGKTLIIPFTVFCDPHWVLYQLRTGETLYSL